MAIQFKDYYDTLGVARRANDDEIRRAFRRLARIYHPDMTGNNTAAESKFKEINEAYEVLGDPDRRKRYDDLGDSWRAGADFTPPPGFEHFNFNTGASGGNTGPQFTFHGSGFSDFFEELFANDGQFRRSAREEQKRRTPAEEFEPRNLQRGDDLEADIVVSLDEVTNGAVRPISLKRAVLCNSCFGVGNVNGHRCFNCDGQGQAVRGESYKVKIPIGIREGQTLRVHGYGDNSDQGGSPGDLYLKVRYGKHHEFRVQHDTLYYDLEIAPWEAVLGGNATVPTLKGRVNIKIPPGTQNGFKLRVRGRGLPKMAGGQDDLVVVVHLQIPAKVNERQRRLWEQLAEEAQPQTA
jgi:curved DNA-binding protein